MALLVTLVRVLSLGVIVSSLFLIFVNGLVLFQGGLPAFNYNSILGTISTFLNFFLGALVIMGEREMPKVLTYFYFLKGWSGRGLYYVFVGVLTSASCNISGSGNIGFFQGVDLPFLAGSIFMFAGFLYLVMGLICLKGLYEKQEAEEAAKAQVKVEKK